MNSNEDKILFAQRLSNIFLRKKGVTVKFQKYGIACVDVRKNEIFLDFDRIFKDDKNIIEELMTFKGLLFHEMHHIKYTLNTGRYKTLNTAQHRMVNILEDGRIETLGVLRYHKLIDYFVYSINNVLLAQRHKIIENPDNTCINGYILMYGRKLFFPDKKLLKQMREICVLHFGDKFTREIEDRVDKYIYEANSNKRLDLAMEILNMINDKQINNSFDDFKGNGSRLMTGRADPKTMSAELRKIQDQIKKAIKKNAQIAKSLRDATEGAEDKSDERQNNIKQSLNEISELEKEYENLRKKRDNTKKSSTWRKYDGKMDDASEKFYEKRRKFTNREESYSPKGAKKLAEELCKTIKSKSDEQQELIRKNTNELLEDLRSIKHVNDNIYSDGSFNATSEMKIKARQLERNIKKLSTELAKGYLRNQKSGKANVRSYINRKNDSDSRVFSSYKPDRIKETKLLVNIFLDGSGSMRGQHKWGKALDALWIINEALNRDQNKLLACQFSSHHVVFKEYDKALSIPRMIGASTSVANALLHTLPTVEAYKNKNNYKTVIDIVITDGAFDNNVRADEMFKKMNDKGHETIQINVDTYSGFGDEVKHKITIADFDALVPQLSKIFLKMKKKALRQVM